MYGRWDIFVWSDSILGSMSAQCLYQCLFDFDNLSGGDLISHSAFIWFWEFFQGVLLFRTVLLFGTLEYMGDM